LFSCCVELGAELGSGAGTSGVDGASDVDGAVDVGVGSSAAAGPANTLVSTAAAVNAAKPRASDLAPLELFTNSHPSLPGETRKAPEPREPTHSSRIPSE